MESSVDNLSSNNPVRQSDSKNKSIGVESPVLQSRDDGESLQSTKVSSSDDMCEENQFFKIDSDHNCSSGEGAISSSAEVATPPPQGSDDEDGGCAQLLASLELSEGTMQALQEFLREEQERQEKLELIQSGNIPDEFEENWNLSQFWYSKATADCLAQECIRLAEAANKTDGSIACIAAPTLYRALRSMPHVAEVAVFELDTRFAVYGKDFVLYDYRSPLSVPVHLRGSFDVVVADPPYLEEDCLTKVALTIKMVSKPGAKVILCTGKVMQELAARLMALTPQKFEIIHEKERLSNPFGCFANYDLDEHCKYKT